MGVGRAGLVCKAGSAPEELGQRSVYNDLFRNGATIIPGVLFMVDRQKSSPLGQVSARIAGRSQRSAYEKAPWKDVDAGVVHTSKPKDRPNSRVSWAVYGGPLSESHSMGCGTRVVPGPKRFSKASAIKPRAISPVIAEEVAT
jgi:hypothetical protein